MIFWLQIVKIFSPLFRRMTLDGIKRAEKVVSVRFPYKIVLIVYFKICLSQKYFASAVYSLDDFFNYL